MSTPMSDEQVQARIEELEREERALRHDEAEAGSAEGERVTNDAERLELLRVELDRLWDYLRQRRALRDAGRNPDDAEFRDGGTVERYLG
jgi:Protein of unknown function (DUF2630)